jgi:hypothetical protein
MNEEEAKEERERLMRVAIEKLSAKGLRDCPRCQRPVGWTAELAAIPAVPFPMTTFPLPPPVFPAIVVTCRFCGFMSMHNLKALGVVP